MKALLRNLSGKYTVNKDKVRDKDARKGGKTMRGFGNCGFGGGGFWIIIIIIIILLLFSAEDNNGINC